jgi:hypothetical protein
MSAGLRPWLTAPRGTAGAEPSLPSVLPEEGAEPVATGGTTKLRGSVRYEYAEIYCRISYVVGLSGSTDATELGATEADEEATPLHGTVSFPLVTRI